MDTTTGSSTSSRCSLLFAGWRHHGARNPARGPPARACSSPAPRSGCWLEGRVLAISLVLVYVGAVMVLFLFVVMMLDINIDASGVSGSTLWLGGGRRGGA